MDLVTLGINMLTEGVDPQIDFSNLDEIRRTAEYCNQLKVHERSPWAGDLVYTAFSGSHQDAIKKGLDRMQEDAERSGQTVEDVRWNVPYLPVDPKDLGRTYEAVIRVNSQSGKGGVAYLLKTDHSLDLPRRLQIEFSAVVKRFSDTNGGEISSDSIWTIFEDEYLPVVDGERWGTYELLRANTSSDEDGETELAATMRIGDEELTLVSRGNGPVNAFLNGINERDNSLNVTLFDYVEHAMSEGGDAVAAAYVDLEVNGQRLWGVGIDPDTSRAALKAITSAVNRAIRNAQEA